jgi:lipopolysaccharide biosynthesis glycosyltransferase
MIIKAALDADIIKNRLALFPNNSAYRRGGQTYFNAGVFMASPKNWKAKKFNLKWPEIASHFEELGFEHDDQDVLNYMTFENREILDSNFNSLVMQGSNIGDRILHFTGQPKPWHFDDGAKSYFTSIEVLKSKIGNGAFGGVNWLFEYQNYWRHEIALLESTVPGTQLRVNLQNLFLNSRRDLMARNDKIKYKLLLMTGRKWLKS